jgi:cytochrome c oxidase cbb3-type subunit 2
VAFREYKIGARLFGVALGGSMLITLYFPSLDISSVGATEIGLKKMLTAGRSSGFSYEDPFLRGHGKPKAVTLTKDPKTGEDIDPVDAYVFEPGSPLPNGVTKPRILGEAVAELSVNKGRMSEARASEGAVFLIKRGELSGKSYAYIEDATATKGWTYDAALRLAGDANTRYIGTGKVIFVREQCWWCHTLLPEETQDWQAFGVPPRLGDFNGENPTALGSDRKAPDLLHVGSRNSSREWMMMHFFNPRLVQPHSIMPRFDYLWGDVDVDGNKIDYAKWRTEYTEYAHGERVYPPEVPEYAADSEIRYLLDFVLSLK